MSGTRVSNNSMSGIAQRRQRFSHKWTEVQKCWIRDIPGNVSEQEGALRNLEAVFRLRFSSDDLQHLTDNGFRNKWYELHSSGRRNFSWRPEHDDCLLQNPSQENFIKQFPEAEEILKIRPNSIRRHLDRLRGQKRVAADMSSLTKEDDILKSPVPTTTSSESDNENSAEFSGCPINGTCQCQSSENSPSSQATSATTAYSSPISSSSANTTPSMNESQMLLENVCPSSPEPLPTFLHVIHPEVQAQQLQSEFWNEGTPVSNEGAHTDAPSSMEFAPNLAIHNLDSAASASPIPSSPLFGFLPPSLAEFDSENSQLETGAPSLEFGAHYEDSNNPRKKQRKNPEADGCETSFGFCPPEQHFNVRSLVSFQSSSPTKFLLNEKPIAKLTSVKKLAEAGPKVSNSIRSSSKGRFLDARNLVVCLLVLLIAFISNVVFLNSSHSPLSLIPFALTVSALITTYATPAQAPAEDTANRRSCSSSDQRVVGESLAINQTERNTNRGSRITDYLSHMFLVLLLLAVIFLAYYVCVTVPI